jgi:hypothetical protein
MAETRMDLPDLSDIHDEFLALSGIGRERFGNALGGRLLLRSGFNSEGIAVVIAASTAGAASLCIDADADRLREGLRSGFVDFVVTNLDEAVRILKNEIRRARPVSVGVTADPATCIDAMIERGLQPDLTSAIPPAQAGIFTDRGAIALTRRPADPTTSILEWTIAENPASAMPRIAQLAASSLEPTRIDTPARRRWLDHSPRYLGRAFGPRQCLRMTDPEADDFIPRARSEFPAANITRLGATP